MYALLLSSLISLLRSYVDSFAASYQLCNIYRSLLQAAFGFLNGLPFRSLEVLQTVYRLMWPATRFSSAFACQHAVLILTWFHICRSLLSKTRILCVVSKLVFKIHLQRNRLEVYTFVVLINLAHIISNTSMVKCKTAVTPLLIQWSYCSLAPSHRHVPVLRRYVIKLKTLAIKCNARFLLLAVCVMFTDQFVVYRKTSSIIHTLVSNTIVDHSDVVGASPCRRCSNYIFILDLTSGFKGFGKDSRKTGQESFKCWDLVRLILETWR